LVFEASQADHAVVLEAIVLGVAPLVLAFIVYRLARYRSPRSGEQWLRLVGGGAVAVSLFFVAAVRIKLLPNMSTPRPLTSKQRLAAVRTNRAVALIVIFAVYRRAGHRLRTRESDCFLVG
jgi:hypothetical protein